MKLRVVFAAALATFCGAVVAGFAASAADDSAAALMQKHAAYVGWHTGDGVVKTLRANGELTREGKPRGTMLSLRYGPAYRDTVVDRSGLQTDSGFTGTVMWTANENGFTVRARGDIVRAQFDVDALFAEGTATGAFTPSILKNDKVDGVDCVVVRLTSPIGFPLDVYVEP